MQIKPILVNIRLQLTIKNLRKQKKNSFKIYKHDPLVQRISLPSTVLYRSIKYIYSITINNNSAISNLKRENKKLQANILPPLLRASTPQTSKKQYSENSEFWSFEDSQSSLNLTQVRLTSQTLQN